ncbi:MAG: DUF4062 domain-containing protein [Chloroflexota bacterium]
MRLKTMVSSVTNGLTAERRAVRPLIRALGYEPVLFEDFTAQPDPPREVCLRAVEASDIYLLLLGEFYGEPYPDTGRSPTHEEWNVATTIGKPIVVFTKRGVTPEPAQTAFLREVQDYRSGIFRKSFDDVADLLDKLGDALAEAATTRRPLVWRNLAQPVTVPWREQRSTSWSNEGTVLEVHLLPVGSVALLPASSLGELSRRLARVGRQHGLFDEGHGVDLAETESAATAIAMVDGRTPEATLRVGRDRAISVTMSLPAGEIGSVILDETQLAGRIARDLQLGAALNLLSTDDAAIAVGLNRVDQIGTPTPHGGVSFPFFGSTSGPVRIEPADAVPVDAIGRGADEIGRELAARLLLRVKRDR